MNVRLKKDTTHSSSIVSGRWSSWMPNICFELRLPFSMTLARLRVYYSMLCNLIGGITFVPRIDKEMDWHERSMIALKRLRLCIALLWTTLTAKITNFVA
jgi:hypothetical protein